MSADDDEEQVRLAARGTANARLAAESQVRESEAQARAALAQDRQELAEQLLLAGARYGEMPAPGEDEYARRIVAAAYGMAEAMLQARASNRPREG